jgi:NAD(P)-dependent dehydrogenase (short-subunit alcohol dehydrogenase family)
MAPGDVCTPGRERYGAALFEKFGNSELIKALGQKMLTLPIGRQAMPEEFAEGVVWLCSDAASYVTGSHIIIDGGHMVS